MNNSKIGAALLGGYVLGRTKKAKLAISVGAMLAGSRVRPGQVAKALQDSPFLHTLTNQVRSELTGAGKAAATSVLTAKADNLADALHERTVGLREKQHEKEERVGDRGGEPDQEDEETDETDETEPDEAEQDEEPREESSERAGRARTRRNTSDQDEGQSRKRKTSTDRTRSTRSRRQDDG